LGYQLGTNGVQMDPRRIRIIEKLSPPSNRNGLERLLGLFVYWRRFIKQFSSHTFYMRQLLKEDVDFCWTPECDQELQYLKSCLMPEPILANIDPNKNFVIMCDAASNTGCGYQILQEGSDGRLHAVSYGGKTLTKAQTRWLPAELELAAVCLASKEIDVFCSSS